MIRQRWKRFIPLLRRVAVAGGVAAVLVNVFAWLAFADAGGVMPGMTAEDAAICGVGYQPDQQLPGKTVCPQCFPLVNACGGAVLPSGAVLALVPTRLGKLAASLPAVAVALAAPRPYGARAPPAA